MSSCRATNAKPMRRVTPRPGYQHSTATYVEGREAPMRCMCCTHPTGAHDATGCTIDGCLCPPMEACEMPARSGGAELVATVERCARAAYDASLTAPRVGARGQALMDPDWSALGETHRGYWREVARAALAAARGAK